MNIRLKLKIYERFGLQCDAARLFGMREDKLSRIIRGRQIPTDDEKKIICEKLEAEESALFSCEKGCS